MNKDTILFGKYRLLHTLGSGRTGTVWLAEHLGLEEYRAIKRVSKKNADYETFRREALVLKELHHPGIPMIYDLEEDLEYFYLIEEYLEGYSLYALIMRQGPIQEADAVRYGMQVCGLVEYMHSACKIPILHLDLQPNNLIICGGTVKLIDFDHAGESRSANISSKRYGTVGCAAPEQYASDRMLDQRTDIYAIGAVLRFMTAGTLKEGAGQSAVHSRAFERIIRRCMESDMDKRYTFAKEVEDALRALCTGTLADDKELKAIPSHILILTGMRAGSGTTHLAFGLVHFLNRQGYRTLYEEHNTSQAVGTLAQDLSMRPDRFGIYTIHGCFLKPWYGPAVHLDEQPEFDVVVKDYGTEWNQAERELKEERAALLVTGSTGIWDECYLRQFISWLDRSGGDRGNTACVFLFRGAKSGCRRALKSIKSLDKHCGRILFFVSPEYADPFRPFVQEDAFFKALWSAVSGSGRSRNRERGWLKRWGLSRELFLSAAKILQRGAGSSELREQDGGQE